MKSFSLWTLPGILVLLLLVPAVRSAPVSPTVPAEFDLPAIDRFIIEWVAEKGLVGLSVAILKDGKIIHAKGYGHAALTKPRLVEVRPETRFAIGSVTKQFTCACILLLAEEGSLSVQDSVAKYYPALSRANEIRVLDLMNHTSGYPDYYPLDFVDRRMQAAIAPDELLRQYAGGKLDFEPGTNYSYSNTGYILLGRIVEKVSGESLGTFLQRRIFQPLGLTNTLYEPPAETPRLARGYTTFALSSAEPIDPEAAGWLGAAGGIYSTPTDLARWNLALVEGKVLKPDSFRLMTEPRTLSTGRVSDYGCGLSVRQQNGRQVISHNGAVAGFNAWSAIVPSTRASVVMLCNLDGGLGGLPGQVFGLLIKEAAAVPKVAAASAVETSRQLFADLQGGKVNRAGFSADFNDYLTAERLAGAAGRLRAYGRPTSADLISTNERGGLEVSVTRLSFKGRSPLRTLMYRRPDGIVEQFFVSKE